MVVSWGIIVLIALFVFIMVIRIFFKSVFKIISIIWLVLFLGMLAFTVLIYADAQDIKKNFATSDNLFLMESSDGKILAGFVTKGQAEPQMFENLTEIQAIYDEKDLDAMLEYGDYYKMFIVNEKSFEGIESVEIGEINVSVPEAIAVVNAQDPVEEYTNMLAKRNKEETGTDSRNPEKIKGVVFGFLFFAGNVEQGPLFLIENFKEGNVVIHKESIVFKLMKYFPASMMDKVMGQMNNMEKEV